MRCPRCSNTIFRRHRNGENTWYICNSCGYSYVDWHSEMLGEIVGLSDVEVATVKQAVNQHFQGNFGGNPMNCTLEQFVVKGENLRSGDPVGFTGLAFSSARFIYRYLKFVPLINAPALWARFDIFVLKGNQNPTVQKYVHLLRDKFSI